MRPHVRFQPLQQSHPMGRRQRLRAQPLAEGHRNQVDRLFGQANRVLGRYPVGAMAELIDKIMRELLQRTIRTEADGSQRLRARDPSLQHIARHLQNNLREILIELQFIGTRRIVDREVTRANDRFAPVLNDTTDAALAERDQKEVFTGASDARGSAVDPLLLRGDLGASGLSQWGPCYRSVESVAEV